MRAAAPEGGVVPEEANDQRRRRGVGEEISEEPVVLQLRQKRGPDPLYLGVAPAQDADQLHGVHVRVFGDPRRKAGSRRTARLSTSCCDRSLERNSTGVPAGMIATSPLIPEVR